VSCKEEQSTLAAITNAWDEHWDELTIVTNGLLAVGS